MKGLSRIDLCMCKKKGQTEERELIYGCHKKCRRRFISHSKSFSERHINTKQTLNDFKPRRNYALFSKPYYYMSSSSLWLSSCVCVRPKKGKCIRPTFGRRSAVSNREWWATTLSSKKLRAFIKDMTNTACVLCWENYYSLLQRWGMKNCTLGVKEGKILQSSTSPR